MTAAQETADKQAMIDAVRLNWRLWTIFQAELLDPDSTVAMDIRTNLLSLAQYIDKHTVDFLAKPTPDKIDTLVNINRELATGLYQRPAEKPSEKPQDSPNQAGSVKISV
jgi:flagellar protein FlaF